MRSIIILLGLLLLLWMGWWQIDDSTLGERARDADTADVLQRGNGPEPETLDPQIARSDSSGAILRDLFEGLTRLSPDGKVVAGAAARWDISADGKIYTCLFASNGVSLRDPMREGASDDDLRELISGIWGRRIDRYSEERTELADLENSPRKIEMYQIGG